MKAKDSFTVEKVKELKKLHGHCRLELLDDNGKVIRSVEHDNTVTPWIANAINKGNFFDTIPNNKEFPLTNWFSGVMLLSKQGDATQSMIPSDARVIACANNASGSDSTDLRRGNYNPDSSSVLLDDDGRVNGYKFVWYWSDTRGNCIADEYIKAVCLTRPDLAIGRYSTDGLPPDAPIGEHFNTLIVTETLANCQLIDYENETAYAVSVSGTTLTVKSYQLDTKQYHIKGVYNNSGVMDITRELSSEDYTLLASASNSTTSVSLVGNIIHVLTWSGTTVTDYAIDTTDWSESHTSYTFDLGTGVSIWGTGSNTIKKDVILYDGIYLWITGTNKNIYKCDTTTPANVDDFTSPIQLNTNGCFAKFSNGDWLKYDFDVEGATCPALYYHDGVLYATNAGIGSVSYGWRASAINVTPYGTVLYSLPKSGRYKTEYYMQIGVPQGHVATVWNDTDGGGTADQWQKTAGLTMRVIYEITEEEPTP